MLSKRSVTTIAALGLDLTVGDPPNKWHPVAWMGSFIGRMHALMPTDGEVKPLLGGTAIVLTGGIASWWVGMIIERLPAGVGVILAPFLLKSTLSLSGLVDAGAAVENALQNDDLVEARRLVSWHLVSRDTSQLDESQLAAATIESLAENLSDGVIAPLFFYTIGGLPAALVYRYVNTCDAMLGYRDAEREWLGKVPARLDDLLNLIPARLSALCLWGADGCRSDVWHIYVRDRAKTDSPNAGHPMSAMAGVLGVELEKVGQYRLGDGLRKPVASDIGRARSLLYGATMIGVGGLALIARWRKNRS